MNDLNVGLVPSRDAVTAALLSRLAYNLDLTPTQYERARSAYETVGSVLAADRRPALTHSKVFPQGSFAIGTVVKPMVDSSEGFDVDLICRLAGTRALAPAEAKSMVGTSLAADLRYKEKLREKARCWRVVFAGEFHIDIAPVVPRAEGGDLIPDRELRIWIPTAPEQYATWFNRLADAAQTQRLAKAYVIKAEVIPFPDDPAERGWLRRLVQVLKRHRCVWRDGLPATHRDYAPISIIITTLAAYAFEKVASTRQFDSSLDLLRAIVDEMPSFVEHRSMPDGRAHWWVKSPVADENFANRWNEAAEWAECFYSWHSSVVLLLDSLKQAESLDERMEQFREAFGETATKGVAKDYGEYMLKVREAGGLRLTGSGLAATSTVVGARVQAHTNFGG